MATTSKNDSQVLTGLWAQLPIPTEATTSRVVVNNEVLRIVEFAMDAGQELTDHASDRAVAVLALAGVLTVSMSGEPRTLDAGDVQDFSGRGGWVRPLAGGRRGSWWGCVLGDCTRAKSDGKNDGGRHPVPVAGVSMPHSLPLESTESMGRRTCSWITFQQPVGLERDRLQIASIIQVGKAARHSLEMQTPAGTRWIPAGAPITNNQRTPRLRKACGEKFSGVAWDEKSTTVSMLSIPELI